MQKERVAVARSVPAVQRLYRKVIRPILDLFLKQAKLNGFLQESSNCSEVVHSEGGAVHKNTTNQTAAGKVMNIDA